MCQADCFVCCRALRCGPRFPTPSPCSRPPVAGCRPPPVRPAATAGKAAPAPTLCPTAAQAARDLILASPLESTAPPTLPALPEEAAAALMNTSLQPAAPAPTPQSQHQHQLLHHLGLWLPQAARASSPQLMQQAALALLAVPHTGLTAVTAALLSWRAMPAGSHAAWTPAAR